MSIFLIDLINVTKLFPGADAPAVDNVSLKVLQGNIMVIVGPSGCGKTTLLRMVNRLVDPSSGNIYIDGRNTKGVDQDELRKNIGYVIQQIGLFPHRKVKDNVALVPRMLKWSEQQIEERVIHLLELIGLNPGEVKDKYPHQLSGGQMQRVGVARAMAADPPIMLMDEPFGAVDPIIRKHLQDEFVKLQQSLGKTILFVTHDIDEALKMGDYIVIMNQGEIVQQAEPIELLSQPENDFVKDLLGENRGVRILDLIKVKDLMESENTEEKFINEYNSKAVYGLDSVEVGQPVKVALETMMRRDTDKLFVVNDSKVVGIITWQAIKSHVNKVNCESK